MDDLISIFLFDSIDRLKEYENFLFNNKDGQGQYLIIDEIEGVEEKKLTLNEIRDISTQTTKILYRIVGFHNFDITPSDLIGRGLNNITCYHTLLVGHTYSDIVHADHNDVDIFIKPILDDENDVSEHLYRILHLIMLRSEYESALTKKNLIV